MKKSRRSFEMSRRTALAGAASAISISALGAKAKAAEPKKGGRLRLGLSGGSTTDSLDPSTWSSFPLQIGLMGGVYNNLVEIDANNEAVPELAEEWDVSSDAKTWTFKIRKGVEFHNGKSLAPEDVVASVEHHRGEGSKSAAKGIVQQIVGVRADGDRVEFQLESPNVDFPYLLNDNHIVIMPAVDGKADWNSGVGTGGYKLKSFQPGVKMLLARQANYWKAGRAHFDEAELFTLSDSAARMNALVSGDVDAINRVDLKAIQFLQRNENVVIENVPSNQHYTLPMFADTAPFNDNNVRLALKSGIDRQELLDKLLHGYGTIGNDQPIGPATRYVDSSLSPLAYDPDKARHYLKQAGLSSLKVDLHASDAAFNGGVDMAVLFKEQAAQGGIDINIVSEPSDGYWSNVWLKKPFCQSYWGGRPTADWMFSLVYAPKAPWNESRWENERFAKLLLEARASLDEAKRGEMYREMQAIVRDEGATIIPLYANYVDARSTKLAHEDKLSSMWDLDGWKIVERWWFA